MKKTIEKLKALFGEMSKQICQSYIPGSFKIIITIQLRVSQFLGLIKYLQTSIISIPILEITDLISANELYRIKEHHFTA